MKHTLLTIYAVMHATSSTLLAHGQYSSMSYPTTLLDAHKLTINSSALLTVQAGVCQIYDIHTNYGKDSRGKENWLRLDVTDSNSCRNQVGKKRDGRLVTYAAFGSRGCHTYLDFYPSTDKQHGDRIASAWGLCDELKDEDFDVSAQSCTECSDEPAPWMMRNGRECDSFLLAQYADRCSKYFMIRNNYCQHSCFISGNGFPGTNCCKEHLPEEAAPSPVPTVSPTTSPTLEPTKEATYFPTPIPKPDRCIECTDRAPDEIEEIGLGCSAISSNQLEYLCGHSLFKRNNLCQHSCYLNGYALDEDICCPDQVPGVDTVDPTPAPSPTPTKEPVSECQPCMDIPSDNMKIRGKECHDFAIRNFQERCANKSWGENKWCQYSCFLTGNGYEGDHCCDQVAQAPTDEPTESPTYYPTDSPTQSPTHSPTRSPSMAPTDEPTTAPTPIPTSSPTVECLEDIDCEEELTCNVFFQCVKPVCRLKDMLSNFGQLVTGEEQHENVSNLDMKACQNQVGMQREDGSTIVYAAFGKLGCHTYLDFYSTEDQEVADHDDRIKGAWGLCEEIYGGRKCNHSGNGVNPVEPVKACVLQGVDNNSLSSLIYPKRDYILLGELEEWEVAPLSIHIGDEFDHIVTEEETSYAVYGLDLSAVSSSSLNHITVELEDGSAMFCKVNVKKVW